MSLTEAKKRANAKYQAKTIASLACRVKKEQAEQFREYCADIGKTSNAVLREYVLSCVGRDGSGGPKQAAGAEQRMGVVSLPSETLEAAQRAAGAAGEATEQFIGRAVETQAQQDKVARGLKA